MLAIKAAILEILQNGETRSEWIDMIDWQNGWQAFDDPSYEERFLQELRAETGDSNSEHPLHRKECCIVGWRGHGWSDFLLYLPREAQYAYVHLTWHEETRPSWPFCELFNCVDAVNSWLQNPDGW